MHVTVFGGANPKPGEAAYTEALLLGRLLAQSGHTVLTGGYIGTMEAVSRGAAEAGGHVIGVTCDQIEAWRKVRPNPWVKEEWRFPTLRERLFTLIDRSVVCLALGGGAGTLAEISLTWNQLITAALPPRPLILIGTSWKTVFDQLFSSMDGYVTPRDRQLLTFVSSVEFAVELVNQFKG